MKQNYISILLTLTALTVAAFTASQNVAMTNRLSNETPSTKPSQPVLGVRSVKLIQVNGLMFKDLNRNGRLDKYEDWRLSSEERSRDLLSQMSLEQKIGFMLISDTRLKGERSMFDAGASGEKPAITSAFNEEDLVQKQNLFTRKPLPTPVMNAAGTTKGVTQFHLRHFIFRTNVPARTTAEWSNRLQALCESQPLGTSRPRLLWGRASAKRSSQPGRVNWACRRCAT